MSKKDEKTKVQIILTLLRYCSLIGEISLFLKKRDITLENEKKRAAGAAAKKKEEKRKNENGKVVVVTWYGSFHENAILKLHH